MVKFLTRYLPTRIGIGLMDVISCLDVWGWSVGSETEPRTGAFAFINVCWAVSNFPVVEDEGTSGKFCGCSSQELLPSVLGLPVTN